MQLVAVPKGQQPACTCHGGSKGLPCPATRGSLPHILAMLCSCPASALLIMKDACIVCTAKCRASYEGCFWLTGCTAVRCLKKPCGLCWCSAVAMLLMKNNRRAQDKVAADLAAYRSRRAQQCKLPAAKWRFAAAAVAAAAALAFLLVLVLMARASNELGVSDYLHVITSRVPPWQLPPWHSKACPQPWCHVFVMDPASACPCSCDQ